MKPIVTADWLAAGSTSPICVSSTPPSTCPGPASAAGAMTGSRRTSPEASSPISSANSPSTTRTRWPSRLRNSSAPPSVRSASVTATPYVVYDNASNMWATRLWWMLRTYGAERVSVLDGGLRSWTDHGGTVCSTPCRYPPARFTARPRTDTIVKRTDVVERRREPRRHDRRCARRGPLSRRASRLRARRPHPRRDQHPRPGTRRSDDGSLSSRSTGCAHGSRRRSPPTAS